MVSSLVLQFLAVASFAVDTSGFSRHTVRRGISAHSVQRIRRSSLFQSTGLLSSADNSVRPNNSGNDVDTPLLIMEASQMDHPNSLDGTDVLPNIDTDVFKTALLGQEAQAMEAIGLSSASTELVAVRAEGTLDAQLYLTLGLMWTVAAVSALDRVAMSVAVVSMSAEFGFTETMKGSISSLFSVGYGLGILPAGIILSFVSPRYVMAFGLALWSVATILTPAAAELLAFDVALPILMVRACVGIGESMVLPTFHRLLSVWTTTEQKSSALAFLHSGFHTGTICAYLLSPIIIDSLDGWRSLFLTYGWLGLFLLGPWLLFAKDAPQPSTVPIATKLSESAVEGPLDSLTNAPWMEFAKSKGAWGMLLAHSSRNWGLYTMLAWLPTFYSEQYGMGVRDSAWLSVMPSVAGAAGGFLAGTLADNIIRNMENKTDDSVTVVRKVFQSIGLLGPAAVLTTLALNIPEEAWIAQLFFMVAVGLQSFNAGGFEAANQDKSGPKWTGMLYSVTSLPAVMLGTFGVYATGVVLDETHDFSLVYLINAGVNVLGAIAFIALYDSKREFE